MYRGEEIAQGVYAVRNLLTGLTVISEGTFRTLKEAQSVAKRINDGGVRR